MGGLTDKFLRQNYAIDDTVRDKDWTSDALTIYIREANKYPQLTQQQELDLGRKIEEARTELHYLPFREVPDIAYNFVYRLGKRLQEGRTGAKGILTNPPDDALNYLRIQVNKLKYIDRKIWIRGGRAKRQFSKKAASNIEAGISFVQEMGLNHAQLYKLVSRAKNNKNVPGKVKRKIESQEKKYHGLKEELVNANLRLGIFFARKYQNRGLPLVDLIQEANMGLMKAAEKFNWKLGFKFSTYAGWWVKQGVQRSLADQSRTIRQPVHVNETMKKLWNTKKLLISTYGRQPSRQEIADEMGVPVEKIAKLQKTAKQTVSLDEPLGSTDDFSLQKIIEDKTVPKTDKEVIQQQLGEKVEEMLLGLNPVERKILRERFGLGTGNDLTLEAIGQEHGVTRERIRQIEKQALGKMKRKAEHLKLFLGD